MDQRRAQRCFHAQQLTGNLLVARPAQDTVSTMHRMLLNCMEDAVDAHYNGGSAQRSSRKLAYHNFIVMGDDAYIHIGPLSNHAILVHKDALQMISC